MIGGQKRYFTRPPGLFRLVMLPCSLFSNFQYPLLDQCIEGSKNVFTSVHMPLELDNFQKSGKFGNLEKI